MSKYSMDMITSVNSVSTLWGLSQMFGVIVDNKDLLSRKDYVDLLSSISIRLDEMAKEISEGAEY